MDGRDFLNVATDLIAGPSPRPEHCRTAIGRAYYAAYNAAVDTIAKLGVRVYRGPQGHGTVRNMLRSASDRELEKMVRRIEQLQSRRCEADYEMDNPNPERLSTAQSCNGESQEVILEIHRLMSNATRRAAVQTAVVAYARANNAGHVS